MILSMGDDTTTERRRSRRWFAVSATGALAWGMTASSTTPGIDVPDDGPWVVGIAHPRGEYGHCVTDSAVEDAWSTADMPSSSASISFKPDAAKVDVQRLLRCLEDSLTSGEIELS